MSRSKKTDRARAIHAPHKTYKSHGTSPVKAHKRDLGLIATGGASFYGGADVVDNGGVRHGYPNRGYYADLKVKHRRAERRKLNREV